MIHRCCWLAAVLLGLASGCAGSPQTAAPATNEPASASSAAPAPASEPAGEPHAQAHEHEPEHHSSAAHDPPDKFDDAAKWSKVFDDPKRDAWQKPDEVVRALGLQPDDVVADLGAGTGYFSLRLARAVPKGRVLAIDVSQGMLDHIEQRAKQAAVTNIETILADKHDPKLPQGVDVLLIVDTYHHLTDRVAYMKQLTDELGPKGRVVVVDFKMGKLPVGPPEGHKIPPAAVEKEMTRAGYRLCRSWDGLPYHYVLFFAQSC